jgi:hypothetical protein
MTDETMIANPKKRSCIVSDRLGQSQVAGNGGQGQMYIQKKKDQ